MHCTGYSFSSNLPAEILYCCFQQKSVDEEVPSQCNALWYKTDFLINQCINFSELLHIWNKYFFYLNNGNIFVNYRAQLFFESQEAFFVWNGLYLAAHKVILMSLICHPPSLPTSTVVKDKIKIKFKPLSYIYNLCYHIWVPTINFLCTLKSITIISWGPSKRVYNT